LTYLSVNLYSALSRQLFRGAPSRGSVKEESLEESIKRTREVPRQRTAVREKTVTNRGTHNRESPFLSGGCEQMASQNHLCKPSISKDTLPEDRGDPIMDALLNWEPVEYVPHVVVDMV